MTRRFTPQRPSGAGERTRASATVDPRGAHLGALTDSGGWGGLPIGAAGGSSAEKVDLVYFNAGGGHRAAATALREVIQLQERPWQVRLVNLMEVLDPTARFHRLTGMAPEDLYNLRLARGWTAGLRHDLRLLQALIRASHGRMLRRLQLHWRETGPDLVVSLVPNFNRVLYESVTKARPGVPFVTLLTDLADCPPHFWIEAGQDQHLICGSPRAVDQARAVGYEETQISLTSGMILRPAFYQPVSAGRAESLQAMGLDPEQATGLVMFGGHGSMEMLRIADSLADRQLILLCGHNAGLLARLRDRSPRRRHAAIGFTTEVTRYMSAADYFIGKPGPGCLSEALQMGLPVITFRDGATMPQERYNTDWLRDQGLGLVIRSVADLPGAVARLLERLPELRDRVGRLDNRALFEVPDILAAQLDARERTLR